jgi:hypothetical protein
MSEVNPWFYIWLAFGLSWTVIGGYTLLLHRRRVAAELALRELGGGGDE